MTSMLADAPRAEDARSLAQAFLTWLAESAPTSSKQNRGPAERLFSVRAGAVTLDSARASKVIRAGLRAGNVSDLVPLLGLKRKEDLSHALNANGTSLWRWARDDSLLPSPTVEQILRSMQLHLFAADVFGGVEDARAWLHKVHPVLDGMTPAEYADNEFGAQKVRGLLAALKYGGVV